MAPEYIRYRTSIKALAEQRLSPQSRHSRQLLANGEIVGDGKLDAGDACGLAATVRVFLSLP
jgi:hypothetical protein